MPFFIFRIYTVKMLFSLQWTYFPYFHWCLTELLSFKFCQYTKFKGKSFKLYRKKEKNVYYKQKIQVFSINTWFIFILWHDYYHISLVATATHEILIFIPLDEYKSCFYRKTWISSIYVWSSLNIFHSLSYIIIHSTIIQYIQCWNWLEWKI
jgi:hypothetical protein